VGPILHEHSDCVVYGPHGSSADQAPVHIAITEHDKLPDVLLWSETKN
jgi:hypothetical protein